MRNWEWQNYFVENFFSWINSVEFSEFITRLADDIRIKIASNYNKDEPDIVKEITASFKEKSLMRGKFFRVKTSAEFIHGSKSQVIFPFDKNELQRELGDIVFITVLRINRNFTLRKLSIIQVKKANKTNWRIDIDQGQLYLLSTFPKFKGVSGFFKDGEFKFFNYSNNLGGYVIFNGTGDLMHTSAILLRKILCSSKSISYQKLYGNLLPLPKNLYCYSCRSEIIRAFEPLICEYDKDLFQLFMTNNFDSSYIYTFFKNLNDVYSLYIYDFLRSLFKLSIGEIVKKEELRFLQYLYKRMKVYSKSPKNKGLQLFIQDTQEFFFRCRKIVRATYP